jgi:hypothetical protein
MRHGEEKNRRQGDSATRLFPSPCLPFSLSSCITSTPILRLKPPTNGRRGAWSLAGLLLLAWCGSTLGDKPAGLPDLVVDQVSIKGGPRLLGSVLGRDADGTLAIAVGRAWLKATHPKFFDQALLDETNETRKALTELRDRIVDWKESRTDVKELDFFLRKESERVAKELLAVEVGTRDEDAPFLVVDVPPATIGRVVSQPPQRRQVALAAWREDLADVETRSVASLTQELLRRKIAAADDPDALLDLLPPRRQSEAAWSARKALIEYHYLKPLDFQGTGDLLVRTGAEPRAADLTRLINGAFKSAGSDPLADLLNPPTGGGTRKDPGKDRAVDQWLGPAVKTAESEGLDGFRVTRVDQDLAARRATVETRFVARRPDGKWTTVWQRAVTVDASKPRADLEKKIEQDPQIRPVLELMKSIGAGGEAQIKTAIRFGAATEEAQKEADSRFFEFRDRHLRRLDGPVLRVAPTMSATKAGRK